MLGITEGESAIKRLDLDSLDNDIPVEILCVDSPTSMWIRPTELKPRYIELVLSMTEHYADRNKGMPINYEDLVAGKLCAVRTSTAVMRGSIIDVDDSGYSDVWLLDHGQSDFFDRSKIYYLADEFRETPAMTIHCGLADVQPRDVEWTCSSRRLIMDMSLGQTVIATVCTRIAENSSLWLKLSIHGNDLGNDLIMEDEALPHRQCLRREG